MIDVTLGVDIGTGSSKGVIVDAHGTVLCTAVRSHSVSTPAAGQVEMDPAVWWNEFVSMARECIAVVGPDARIVAVGVSGMGPCVAIADDANRALRPAILYGIDTRATRQIAVLTEELGSANILNRTGSTLSTQAVGPKLLWLSENEPEVFAEARRMFMPSSWLVSKLTGEYVLDHHSASQCNPLYDRGQLTWIPEWSSRIAPLIKLPRLLWPGERAGVVLAKAAVLTGIPEGTPVIAGTIDAWAEAVSVDAQNIGDLMLMYGTTMFLIDTVDEPTTNVNLWGTNGAYPGTHSLAGGMATSGAITSWLRELFGSPDFEELLAEAEAVGPGAGGLLMLPYFAGERTPIADPGARGVIAGLTVEHRRGHLYRAALEATALGVRHNVESFRASGARIDRIVAVGGGTRGALWTQIVSDVTGLTQQIPTVTVGASYGVAYLAARLTSHVSIAEWNPVLETRAPHAAWSSAYDELYAAYRSLYTSTRPTIEALGRIEFPTG